MFQGSAKAQSASPPDGSPYGHSTGGDTGAASPVAIQALSAIDSIGSV